jgi:signal transduction histidine kinase
LKNQIQKTNEELRNKNRLMDEFINIAAHELRTPIQPILGLTGILQSKANDPEQRELLDVTLRNAKRLQRLTENILDVTKIESQSLKLDKEQFNLNENILNVIKDVKSQIPNPDKLKILYSELLKPIYIEGDKLRLYQVIANLLRNAIKFTKEGTISISTDMKDNTEVTITIKDTGAGIHPEILPKLFTKFATKSDIGTGLGLYISKVIVEAHAGRIWAENNSDGKGATFAFTLPLSIVH